MTVIGQTPEGVDEWGARRSLHGPDRLSPFAAATVLDAADVHLASMLCRLGGLGGDTDDVGLAIALACRAVRHGSVTVDLATVAESVSVDDGADVDVSSLPWPEPDTWIAAVAACPLVAVGDDADTERGCQARPLRLLGSQLALDRYWRHERAIAASIKTRLAADAPSTPVEEARLDALFGSSDVDDRQRQATAAAVEHRFAVIAGGPGTGKTTTIAAVLALLLDADAPGTGDQVGSSHAHGDTPSDGLSRRRVALAAPTGKAAARLTEAVHDRARTLAEDGRIDRSVADAILTVDASTLHRLLGRKPGSDSRFRHDAANRLPHDVVIVDETSMVSLSMMTRLLAAVRDDAQLILVGDPRQLTSVEAGAVLGDIVAAATPGSALDPNVVVLDRVHRFAGGIGELAGAIVDGDADAVLAVLSGGASDVEWVDVDVATTAGHTTASDAIGPPVVATASAVVAAAAAGDAAGALAAMARTQLLCAHRRGPYGAATWRREVEHWLTDEISGYSPYGWFAGRPLLVTQNDYALELFNGDTGVAVATPGSDELTCAFERRGEIIEVSPSRLRAIETLYAMTIHKSQGSQFDHPVVVLPEETSPILTRELFYTAVTRASARVTVVGTEASIRAAIARPVQRASGLQQRLV